MVALGAGELTMNNKQVLTAGVEDDFILDDFFPYQVRIFYSEVSQCVRKVYGQRYGLSVSEWRVLAVMGSSDALTASDVCQLSSIDKVEACRAIQRLQSRHFIDGKSDHRDRRRRILQLTVTGQAVFQDLAGKVKELEKQLLNNLDIEDQNKLRHLMLQVRLNAQAINRAQPVELEE